MEKVKKSTRQDGPFGFKRKDQYIRCLPSGSFQYQKSGIVKTFPSMKEAKEFRANVYESQPEQRFIDYSESSIRISLQELILRYDTLTANYFFEVEDFLAFQERLQRYEILKDVPFVNREEDKLPTGWSYAYLSGTRSFTWQCKYNQWGSTRRSTSNTLDEALDKRLFAFRCETKKRDGVDHLPIVGPIREKYPILHFFNEELAAYQPTDKGGRLKEAFDFFRAKLIHRLHHSSEEDIEKTMDEIEANRNLLLTEAAFSLKEAKQQEAKQNESKETEVINV